MSGKDQKGLAHLGIILAVFVLAVVGLVGWRVMSQKKDEQKPASQNQAASQSEQPKTQELQFSQPIFNASDISFIGPLGELNGGYEEAQTIAGITINIKPGAVAGGKEIEVRAPAAMTLESYAYYKVGSEPSSWALIFRLSSDAAIKFDHITRASDKIMAATTTTPKSDSREETPKSKVSFTAGEVVAYTSGTSTAHNWNIYMNDNRHKNSFVNQARYESSHLGKKMISAVCPFNYYDEAKKADFIALMGQRKAGETNSCGEVSRDKAGTLSGMWHLSADAGSGMQTAKDGQFESPFSIYKNSAGVISINQINGKRLDVEPGTKTNKDPYDVTSEHCYETKDANQRPAGYAFFKLNGANQMSLVYNSSGSCPANFPSQGAKTYYR